MADKIEQLEKMIQPVIAGLDPELVLWGCELVPVNERLVLRVYLDRDTGVSIDDCERVSRQLSALLDVEAPIQGGYTLEVSSPGVDRSLFKVAHFQRYLGQMVRVRMHTPIEGQRNFKGLLQGADEHVVTLQTDDKVVELPVADIQKAKLEQ